MNLYKKALINSVHKRKMRAILHIHRLIETIGVYIMRGFETTPDYSANRLEEFRTALRQLLPQNYQLIPRFFVSLELDMESIAEDIDNWIRSLYRRAQNSELDALNQEIVNVIDGHHAMNLFLNHPLPPGPMPSPAISSSDNSPVPPSSPEDNSGQN